MKMAINYGLAAIAILAAVPASAINVSLGASNEIFTLYGLGAIAPGIGSFDVGQGSGTFNGTTSTFTLSGAIAGGDPGYNTGTYSFVTRYDGASTPLAGPNAPFAQSNPANTNFFFYNSFHSSTSMTLLLNTPGQNYVIPLVVNGGFVAGTGFSFLFTGVTCTGVASCLQNNVGLAPGATIFGPVTISASFTNPTPVGNVPEPSIWAMFVLAFGLVGSVQRARRSRWIAG